MSYDAPAMPTSTDPVEPREPVDIDEAPAQTHYQLLEVDPWATPSEIQDAYQRAQAAFAPDSLATYMLYTPAEAQAVFRRLQSAVRVLSNPNERERYDRALVASKTDTDPPLADAGPPDSSDPAAFVPVAPWNPPPEPEEPLVERVTGETRVREIVAAATGCDGPTLLRLREARNIELSEINLVTKISTTNLRFIEEDNLDALPAPVYLRGYLKQIADLLQVDPEWVVSGYMARFDPQPARIR